MRPGRDARVSSAALRVEGLGVSFGALVALEDVTWNVGAGEILGIIGLSGAGKRPATTP